VIIAAVLIVRVPIKNALQSKVMGTTDYMLWKKYDQETQQYKGEDTSFVKTSSEQKLSVTQSERKGYVSSTISSTSKEDTASSGVEEGAEPILKTIDLNEIMPEDTK
jgi:hypothetical protein